jgi:lipid-binding SYLF domain-containing protein
VLVALTRRGIQNVAKNRFRLGSGVVAGPVGDAAAMSDAQRRADILGYSRSRGEVAGTGLNGASVGANRDANQRFYGRRLRTGDIAFRGMAGGTGLVREWGTMLADVMR